MSEFDHQLWSTFFGGNIRSPHAPGRTLLHARTIVDDTALAGVVLARRKPLLLLRLSGVFLLRLAERRFVGLLFQEPPRSTRFLRTCRPSRESHLPT